MADPGGNAHHEFERASHRRGLFVAAFTLLIGLAFTLLAAGLVRQSALEEAQQRYWQDSSQASVAVQSEVDTYLARLKDVGTYVVNTPGAPNEGDTSFTSYVQGAGIFDQLDAVVGVFFLHRVEEGELDTFLAMMRVENPEFAIVPLAEHQPGSPYYILSYYTPGRLDLALPVGTDTTPFESVTGLIQVSNATGNAVAGSFQDDPVLDELAAQTNYPLLDDMLQLDFFLGVPIRGTGADSTRYVGWVGATIDDFAVVLDKATGTSPVELGIALQLDLTSTGLDEEGNLSREVTKQGAAGSLDDALFSEVQTFDIDGVQWRLTTWVGPEAAPTPISVYFTLLGGFLASLLAAGVMYLRIRARERERAFASAIADKVRLQQDILDSVTDAMVVIGPDGQIISSNPAWSMLWRGRRRSGVRADDLPAESQVDGPLPVEPVPPVRVVSGHPSVHGDLGKDYLARMAPTVRSARTELEAGIRGVLDGKLPEAEADIAIEQGSKRRWFSVRVTPLGGDQGGAVVVHTDITERKRSQDELEMKASHDPLTGLLNREAFESEVSSALRQARATGAVVAVIFMDLDGFKPINDTYGHAVGDDVLRAVAQRIGGAVRTSDRVARLGGDEFVALISPLHDTEIAEQTAERIRRALGEPVHVDGRDLIVRASIGVALAEAPLGLSPQALIHMADEAMYASKQSGGNRVTRSG